MVACVSGGPVGSVQVTTFREPSSCMCDREVAHSSSVVVRNWLPTTIMWYVARRSRVHDWMLVVSTAEMSQVSTWLATLPFCGP